MNNNLQELLMAVSILFIIGTVFVTFTKTLTDYFLKKKMVDKGFVNDDTQAIFKTQEDRKDKYPSLKWGLIIFFGGLSLMLMELFDFTPESPLPYGMFALAVSLGFLIYFFIVKREENKEN